MTHAARRRRTPRLALLASAWLAAVALSASVAPAIAQSSPSPEPAVSASPAASAPASPDASGSPAPSASPVPGFIGADLPPFASMDGDPATGQPAPPLAGLEFDGTPLAYGPDGRPKMVVFLAHWCPHCQREVPIIQDWVDAGSLPEGIDLVSVATAIDPTLPNHPPDVWLVNEGWTAPVIVDPDDAIAMRYGLTSFPFWVFIDGEGTIIGRLSGVLEADQLTQLADLLLPAG